MLPAVHPGDGKLWARALRLRITEIFLARGGKIFETRESENSTIAIVSGQGNEALGK